MRHHHNGGTSRVGWAAAVVTACGIALAGCTSGGAGTASAPASETVAAPAAENPADPNVVFSDEFDGADLAGERWETPDRADLIRQGDGGLNLVVSPLDTENGVEAALVPKFSGPFHEMTFTVMVPAFAESGPGGGAMVVRQASGRNHEVVFGPSAGHLEIVALVCGRPSCTQYDEFVAPARSVSFERGEVVPIRIVQAAGAVQFFAREQLLGESGADDASALTDFGVELYGAEGESWQIVLDSLRLLA